MYEGSIWLAKIFARKEKGEDQEEGKKESSSEEGSD
jgi:hypothetical protein